MDTKYLLAKLVVFSSAFLLFQIQPMIARVILPAHGGTAAVWTTCMMFFQLLLLAGYAWAHCSQALISRIGFAMHFFLLSVAVGCSVFWLPSATNLLEPSFVNLQWGLTIQIIHSLALYVGLPFFLLASTGPIIQNWISADYSNEKTYRLYAYSNAGSILGLITYPFVFERFLGVSRLLTIWAAGYLLFAIAFTILAFLSASSSPVAKDKEALKSSLFTGRPGIGLTMTWIGLAAIASVFFLSTTNYLCQEVASTPLLWVVPLTLYLLSFVICFDSPRWYIPQLWSSLFAVCSVGSILLVHLGTYAGFGLQVIVFNLACFAGCMTCHGELAFRRPKPIHLTRFYLAVSFGGALGGIFVSVFAPHLFDGFYEFQISLALVAGVSLLSTSRFFAARCRAASPRLLATTITAALLLSLLASTWSLQEELRESSKEGTVYRGRNEYGLTRVKDTKLARQFISGRTVHGTQWLSPDLQEEHSGYYRAGSGVQVAFDSIRSIDDDNQLRIAVLGLGAGAMATWFNDNDEADFYEINPMVVNVARDYFSFLKNSKGTTRVVTGDGRIELARRLSDQKQPKYDLIFMDAFASDSIPIHLLTTEAVDIYLGNLADHGVIVFHITNHFVDLTPVILGHTAQHQLHYCYINHRPDITSTGTKWLIVGREKKFFRTEVTTSQSTPLPAAKLVHWTDDHASVVSQLNWNTTVNWDAIKAAKTAPNK